MVILTLGFEPSYPLPSFWINGITENLFTEFKIMEFEVVLEIWISSVTYVSEKQNSTSAECPVSTEASLGTVEVRLHFSSLYHRPVCGWDWSFLLRLHPR